MRFFRVTYSLLLLLVVMLGTSCQRHAMPKPYAYFRLSLPSHEGTPCTARKVQFDLNKAAQVQFRDASHPDYFNIDYPSIHATIHCSYLPIQNNLPSLLKDAQDMVYSHTVKASAIPEQEYSNTEHHVYGVLYELEGNTATPVQFFLTDSMHHFFRAAVYINTIPNQDSLAPVIDFLRDDVRTIIESFRWNEK